MTALLLAVGGTGTNVGKTIVARTILDAWKRARRRVVGIKPIETGVGEDGPADVMALEQASTFHVTRSTLPYLLGSPVSPHLAARRASCTIDIQRIVDWTCAVREQADAVVLELAGGLFTPISDSKTNADLLRAILPTRTILVAPDRLGVLHDVIASTRAAAAAGVALDAVVLSEPGEPDASTGTNAGELRRVARDVMVLGVFPREPASARDALAARILDVLGL